MACIALNEVKVQITQVDLNTLTPNQTLWRIHEIKNLIFNGKYGKTVEEKRSMLLEIARKCLNGKSICLKKNVFNETFDDIDINFLTEQQLEERYKELSKYADCILFLGNFIDIARFALTGVPF